MIKIAVTDDHPLVIDGIRSVLSGNEKYQLISGFGTCKDTLLHFKSNTPDLLFLDVNLPDRDGTELCRELKARYPLLKIIALSSFSDIPIVKSMIAGGAEGYVLKSAGKEVILAAIESVVAGKQYLDPAVQQIIISETLHQRKKEGFMPKLSRREMEVLQLIAEELTNQDIAEKLFINHKTVETHRTNLIQKLGVKNTAGLIKKAMEKGLIR